ncbi:VOC family protein [Rothia nasimurium]|uniref:Glyoxalase/bleomycin resistance/extradiol dioxygenase family protein n=1 Tax=Luteibacter anthropi TaxID=564369 RepID=A0A7X5ZJY6_9GAMM|nr:VOC family protein [Luteibacter anthropi]NII08523.1 glyoxalase/bleomycin resistance/extradiol dioxygenase family protein [Luteibacter anthropi]
MSRQLFINLPVVDVAKSRTFFTALGFAIDPRFSGDTAVAVVINDTTTVMLLPHERFKDFTPKAICDTSKAVEVLFSIGCDSREEVDSLVAKALAAGGTTYDEPEDLGFMYSHSFIDLDGHGWGVLHMSGSPEG